MTDEEMAYRFGLHNRSGLLVGVAVVDEADADRVIAERWYLGRNGYVQSRVGYVSRRQMGRLVYLHRFVLGLTTGDGVVVDHRDGNPLNCCRDNLRIGTQRLNTQNRHMGPYRGVSWHKAAGRWRAYATVDGKQHHLGLFDDRDEAADAVSAWRRENMPFSIEPS